MVCLFTLHEHIGVDFKNDFLVFFIDVLHRKTEMADFRNIFDSFQHCQTLVEWDNRTVGTLELENALIISRHHYEIAKCSSLFKEVDMPSMQQIKYAKGYQFFHRFASSAYFAFSLGKA